MASRMNSIRTEPPIDTKQAVSAYAALRERVIIAAADGADEDRG